MITIKTMDSFHLFGRIKHVYQQTRHFGKRASHGMGLSKGAKLEQNIDKLNELYQTNSKMQKLWNDTFERISTLQNQHPSEKDPLSNHLKQASLQPNQSSNGSHISNNRHHLNGFGKLSNNKVASTNKFLPKDMFSTDEVQKMKLSFAEGYFYGQNRRPGSRLGKSVIIILLGSAGLFFLLRSSAEKSLRRVFTGNRSFEISPEEIDVGFADIKGCDESKQELSDIVEYLKNPNKFSRLGGKLPKGVLLVGPPGTGKTLLARAVAGEAGVPFFHASGSEFDEILVGQGARRIRDLFESAKRRTPCVIFLDEIDSVGGKRSSSVLHPYANQTINQLLSEMDGFSQNEGVIVMGATNRESDLDKALLRPGRFDVRVTVPVPDYNGRRELFDHYLSKVKASFGIDIDILCRTTIGFTGADIENLINQAALKSATDDMDEVNQKALEFARDKVLMGPELRHRVPDKEQNLVTAYHEGGHALVAFYTEKAHNLHKVTIISRGQSMGHTSFIPEKDYHSYTKEQLQASIDVALGGRVAEEIINGTERVTTGCSDDLKNANALATKMVKDFGMSEKVGMRVIREESSPHQTVVRTFSEQTAELVEAEIGRILAESKTRVFNLLSAHKRELKLLAEALLKYETLDAAAVKLLLDENK